MEQKDLAGRFDYHKPKNEAKENAHETVRRILKVASYQINDLLVEGREKALAITKLEEAMFWANASLARNDAMPDEQNDPK
jgi:hypothetical protein